ncbi:MAG: SOS response-associated peptidase [Candidatus Limiplasma sp.]|nr:SOS response-associated peptidase [Candidatus Limiplasma sp.]
MCGRYFLDMDREPEGPEKLRVILEELNRGESPLAAQVSLGEVFPSQLAPVIVAREGGGFTVKPMRWGFPRAGGGGVVINSRSEKAEFTPMFQRAVRERRCLIPASGFYEWRRSASGGKTKDKFAFLLQDPLPGEMMYLAGLYGLFSGGFAGGGYDGFAVLTQGADEQMAPYHDRMPVILREEALKKAWLAAPKVPFESLRERFAPPPLRVLPA